MGLKQYRKVKGTKISDGKEVIGYYYQGVNGTHHIIEVEDRLKDFIVSEYSIRMLFAINDKGEEIYVGDKMWFEEYNHEDDDDFNDEYVRRGIKQGYRHECVIMYDDAEAYTESTTDDSFPSGFCMSHFINDKSQRPQVKFGKL